MNTRNYIIPFLIISVFWGSLACPSEARKKKAKEEVAVISGQVVNINGEPVAGAVVTAMEGTQVTKSGADGSFSVKSGVADYICVEADDFETRNVYLPDVTGGLIVLDSVIFKSGTKDMVNVPFEDMEDRRIVAPVTRVRMSDYEDKITDNSWKTVLQAAGFGMFGTSDIRGNDYVVVSSCTLLTTSIIFCYLIPIQVMYGRRSGRRILIIADRASGAIRVSLNWPITFLI